MVNVNQILTFSQDINSLLYQQFFPPFASSHFSPKILNQNIIYFFVQIYFAYYPLDHTAMTNLISKCLC